MKQKLRTLAVIALLIALSAGAAAEPGGTAADITFEEGLLSLTEANIISFGEYTIYYEQNQYPAKEAEVAIQVNDLRGTGEGWEISVRAETFTDAGGANTLPGAYITLTNGSASSNMPGATEPDVVNNIVIDCDGGVGTPVASAAPDSGMGAWKIQWSGSTGSNANVTLTVPGGAATVGYHSTTITWTSNATP